MQWWRCVAWLQYVCACRLVETDVLGISNLLEIDTPLRNAQFCCIRKLSQTFFKQCMTTWRQAKISFWEPQWACYSCIVRLCSCLNACPWPFRSKNKNEAFQNRKKWFVPVGESASFVQMRRRRFCFQQGHLLCLGEDWDKSGISWYKNLIVILGTVVLDWVNTKENISQC